MSAPGGSAGQPGGDQRFEVLDAALRRHRHRPDALLEILHVAQQQFGHLPREVLAHVARRLGLPGSRVYGVASFYHLFTLAPKGTHRCTVCLGTACYVKGAGAILAGLSLAHEVATGGTTADGALTLEVARCVGTCGIAPVVLFDGEMAGRQDADTALARTMGWGRP